MNEEDRKELKKIAMSDQATSAAVDQARMFMAFYQTLREAGLDREQALFATSEWQKSLLDKFNP